MCYRKHLWVSSYAVFPSDNHKPLSKPSLNNHVFSPFFKLLSSLEIQKPTLCISSLQKVIHKVEEHAPHQPPEKKNSEKSLNEEAVLWGILFVWSFII